MGVVAFKIEANPDAIYVCPQTIKENGITLVIRPIIKRDLQRAADLGAFCPLKNKTAHRISAAILTRRVTIVSGGNSETATPTKKNEPPQSMDRDSSIPQSLSVITLLIAVFT